MTKTNEMLRLLEDISKDSNTAISLKLNWVSEFIKNREDMFLAMIIREIREIDWQLKNGSFNEEIKKGIDKEYWMGYRTGLVAGIVDHFYSLIEEVTGKSIEEFDFKNDGF